MSGDHLNLLKYFPLSSVIDTGFWHVLANKKLEILKLDDSAQNIIGFYRNDAAHDLPPLISINYESFNENLTPSKGSHLMNGKLIVTNTIEDLINKDKKELLSQFGTEIWNDILQDKSEENLSNSLSKFLLLVYADLKKYCFHYWFAFPALCYPQECQLVERKLLSEHWNDEKISELQSQVSLLDNKNQSYFLVAEVDNDKLNVFPISSFHKLVDANYKIYFAFADPCTSTEYPGWLLRNYLAFIAKKFQLNSCHVISYRLKGNHAKHSLVFSIKWQLTTETLPSCVGWEKNENNKLMPRKVDLKHVLDPLCLAENSVDLNLKLMRWRLVPSLDLDKISSTRCLILGSGTLGCYVARGLLAWGVRTMTFVDNSTISYSNPVRQSLFNFDDCLDGGKAKAETAANNLKAIFPGVNSCGIDLSIPMPGHPVNDKMIDQVKNDIEKLKQLIDNHEVVFLLMDTRESRWLPTLLAAVNNKIVINAALGFDTFLVLRHGILGNDVQMNNDLACGEASSSKCRAKKIYGSHLGCYFCNDVVAPGDSTKDRTLDQQCTVTRPGVSMFASALAVELMVSILQHPLSGDAPALTVAVDECYDSDVESSLGIVPHQIRGFLSRFQQVMPTCEKFDKCTACSVRVIEQYKKDGFEFLLKVFNDSNYLEELTGLKLLHNETVLDDIWAVSDTEDEIES